MPPWQKPYPAPAGRNLFQKSNKIPVIIVLFIALFLLLSMILFFNSKTDILRIPQADHNYRYPKYYSFSNRSIFADMLEQASFESGLNFAPDV